MTVAGKPKAMLVVGLVLLLASLASCGFGVTRFVSLFSDVKGELDSAARHDSGTIAQVDNTTGWILVFTNRAKATCLITDQNGNSVQGSLDNASTELSDTVGSEILFLAQVFEASASSSYSISCGEPNQLGDFRVVTVKSFNGVKAGLFGAGAGALAFIVGGICMIIGLIQRGRWKRLQREQQPIEGGFGSPSRGGPPPMTPPPPGGFNNPTPPGPGPGAPPGW